MNLTEPPLAPAQDLASHLWMPAELLRTTVKVASLALGEIPSVPEKGPAFSVCPSFPLS
jgi:hypothetical protein